MKTYPNQKIVRTNKERVEKDFIQLSNKNLSEALIELTHSELKLYLTLAKNCDGFQMALSQVAVEQFSGLKKTAYHSAYKGLVAKKYIIENEGNRIEFYESSQSEPTENTIAETSSQSEYPLSRNELHSSQSEPMSSQNDREIDNIDNIDKKIDNNGGETKKGNENAETQKEINELFERFNKAGVIEEVRKEMIKHTDMATRMNFLREYSQMLEEIGA